MHRRPDSELLPFDPKIQRTLCRLKKIKVDNKEMEDQTIDIFDEGQSDHNEMPGIREPTLGNCWRPMMNKEYSGIQHQPIDPKEPTIGEIAYMQAQSALMANPPLQIEDANYVNNISYTFRPNNNLPSHYHPGLRNMKTSLITTKP